MPGIIKKINLLSVTLIILLLFLTIFACLNWKITLKRNLLKKELGSLEQKVKSLQRRSDNLKSQISQKDLSAYLERLAREDLNLQKEGERVAAFPLEAMNATSISDKISKKQSLWEIIFGH